MRNNKIISLTIMSVVMGTTIATASADGIRQRFRDPVAFSEVIRAEREALRSGDYERWKSAVENSGQTEILEAINKDNFAQFREAFTLCEQGDLVSAEAIINELEGAELPRCGLRHRFDLAAQDRQALEAAFANADYAAWKELMEKGADAGWKEYLTEENFQVIVRAQKLRESGDHSGASALLEENDVPQALLPGKGRGRRANRALVQIEDQAALEEAYRANDYESWKELLGKRGGKILEIVNEKNFAEFARAKLLQNEGKAEEAKEILDRLGFPFQERKVRNPQMAAA